MSRSAAASLYPAMEKPSDVFKEAVRHRADGVGLVPIGLIKLLTAFEWRDIRVMTRNEARRHVATFDAELPSPGTSRTKTPTMDPSVIDRLLKEIEHGH